MTTLAGTHAWTESNASRELLDRLFVGGAGFLLFGDYLALSISQALNGVAGNWVLYAGIAQLGVLALAAVLGRTRGVLLIPEVLCAAGLGLVWLLHLASAEVRGASLGEYGTQKLLSYFGMCMPALLCGIALGRCRGNLPRWMPVFATPLLAMCLLSLATDPAQLTIAFYHRLQVHADLLVLPAHQGLAFALAKSSLACYAMLRATERASWTRRAGFAVLGGMLGLVVLSGARGYTLALAAALALLWALRRGQLRLVIPAVGVAWILFQTSSSKLLATRLDPTQVLESVAYRERQAAWATAWEAFCGAPLFGHGPGGFAWIHHFGARTYPHNLGLEIASEAGVVGLLLLGTMLFASARRIWHLRRTQLDATAWFAIGFFCFALVGAMTVGDLIRNHFVFFAVGMLAGCSMRARPDSTCE